MSVFENETVPWACADALTDTSVQMLSSGRVYVVTDCFVFQLIVCCDTRNNREVFGEQSALIWRLCSLYLSQICGLWSGMDVCFEL